jgi:hypothetical protein
VIECDDECLIKVAHEKQGKRKLSLRKKGMKRRPPRPYTDKVSVCLDLLPREEEVFYNKESDRDQEERCFCFSPRLDSFVEKFVECGDNNNNNLQIT